MEQFLEDNCLDMVINTRDGISNGVEENKCVLSVFSVPNYANKSNKGGILRINKNLEVIPQILKGSATSRSAWVSDQHAKANIAFTEN